MYDTLSQLQSADVSIQNELDDMEIGTHKTELDSHANMPVVGKNAFILSYHHKTANVSAFSPDYPQLKIPIVDAAVRYSDPYDGMDRYFVIYNALYVKSMENNLLPPFIMREKGLLVNDRPKIQSNNPTVDDHAILFEDGFRVPLLLHGTFSYFPSTKPTAAQLDSSDEIYLLTPEVFNPHDLAYSQNERAMLDWEGNLIEPAARQKFMLEDIIEDETISSTLAISELEANAIDAIFEHADIDLLIAEEPLKIPREADETMLGLSNISLIYNDATLYHQLRDRWALGSFMSTIGSTDAFKENVLFDFMNDTALPTTNEESISEELLSEEQLMDELFAGATSGQIDLDQIMTSSTTAQTSRGVDASHLSKIWKIDIDTAKKTLATTTQHSKRTDNPKLSRNYATNDRMLRYKRIHVYFYMDTFFASSKGGKSSRGHTCCQLFVTDKGFVYVVPMRTKADVIQAVKQFAREIGAPDAIISDAAREQVSGDLRKFLSSIGTTLRVLEEGTPWSNRAELYIGIIKEAFRKDMKDSNCPLPFWDYCVERRARINNLTAKNLFQLHGTTPHQAVTGEQGDISNICQYAFYEFCYYREHTAGFPHNQEVLGRVLGPARGEGNEMAQWILKANGNVVPRRSHRPLKTEEIYSETERAKRDVFDQCIERRWGSAIHPPKPSAEDLEEWETEDEPPRLVPDIEDPVDANGKAINQQPAYDKLLQMEVQLQLGDELSVGRVTRRAIGPDGTTTGKYDDNPLLNSIIYEVEFPDGLVREYAANVIAENLLNQVDDEGYTTTMLESIVDYNVDYSSAIDKKDKYVTTRTGQKRLRHTTKGWKLLVRWKDGSETWIPLTHMKESHPVETAEFAMARRIDNEAAFAWWVPYVLRKRENIISKVKARMRKTERKYGIQIPTSVEDARRLDTENGNTFWMDALAKEMSNVGIAFEILEQGQQAPPGWRKASGHLVWDVKMDFTRKARWVLDGHKQPSPNISTYAGVVSRESVRIAFTYAALNGLKVCAGDILNAYLQAPSSTKDYIVCGPEFGLENVGKVALIHRALYGGKSAGRDFRNHLRSCMVHLGFQSCPADPDVWMRPALKADGSEYWEYILLYVDDALCISEQPDNILRNQLGKYFKFKEASIGPPKIYLGGHCREVELDNGVKCWGFSASQYVQAAVKNVEEELGKRLQRGDRRFSITPRAEAPLSTNYRPELDTTRELQAVDSAYYQSLIGILRWMVELGRVDICLEVSLMSSHLALPREGHLAQLFHIFSYLKKYHNTELVFDPSDPIVDTNQFELRDWTTSEFGHIDGKELVPSNMPQPRGVGFVRRAKVDADHAADSVTRRSRTGFMVWLNCALIYWTSKKQTSVESSSFGSEFIAMKQCCEYLRGLSYKLRMMGIPVEGPAYIYGDNQSVLANTTIPESTLKKKSQSIAYHFVREGCARDEWRTTYVSTHDNEADLLTKPLPPGEKRRMFVRKVLHHIFATVAKIAGMRI